MSRGCRRVSPPANVSVAGASVRTSRQRRRPMTVGRGHATAGAVSRTQSSYQLLVAPCVAIITLLSTWLPPTTLPRPEVLPSPRPDGAVVQDGPARSTSTLGPRPVHFPHRSPRPAGPLRPKTSPTKTRADALDVQAPWRRSSSESSSQGLRVTDNAVILDVGFKSGKQFPLESSRIPSRSRKATRWRYSSSISRTRRARSFSRRRRPTSCGSGKIAWPERPAGRGTLVKKIKGGVVVNLMVSTRSSPAARSRCGGCRIDGSQADLRVRIIKLNKRRRNIV